MTEITNGFFLQDTLSRLKQVLGSPSGNTALHEPVFEGNESSYIQACLKSGWVSSAGTFVERFETELAAYTGVSFAIAVVNGTSALHICLLLAGVEPDDEVMIPALTFIATANAVAYCGAIPHLVDVSEQTMGMDPVKLDVYLGEISEFREGSCWNRLTGRRIKAVMPMHTLGHPVHIEPLQEVCSRYKLELVEDAAQSLGSLYQGRHTGNWGSLSAISFNGNKIITTGGGGAVLTHDAALARMARHLTTTARLPHRWKFIHDRIGYNYRMPNVNAAMGVAQLEELPRMLHNKRKLAAAYQAAFRDCDGISCFTESTEVRSNYWLNALILDTSHSYQLDALLALTNDEGISTRPLWTPLHQQTMYSSCPRMDLSVTETLAQRVINIPSSASLGGRL